MSDDERMVERVARAMHEATREQRALMCFMFQASERSKFSGTWEEKPAELKAVALIEARAAIAAMREPTNAMYIVGRQTAHTAFRQGGEADADLIWRAMIDQALKPTHSQAVVD